MPDFYDIVIEAANYLMAIYAAILCAVSLLVSNQKWRTHAGATDGGLSIIIPFRNEGAEVYKRFAEIKSSGLSLKSQILFVDDHSSDFKGENIEEHLPEKTQLITLPDQVQGKKQAIAYAMQFAEAEWTLTNDMDAVINPEILKYISGLPSRAQLYVLPIKPGASKSVASKFFAIEFIILQAVGIAFAKMNQPVLANGAGLLIRRNAFLDTMQNRNDWNISGGDDIFTMLAIRKVYGRHSVDALITDKPIIETSFHESLTMLWRQRVRWVSKVPSVGQLRFGILAWFVLFINVLTLGVVIHTVNYGVSNSTLILLSLKWIPEMALAAWGVLYFRRPDCAIWIIPALVLYPLYLPALIIAALFWTPRWK
jgi:cellulose synthase/poly-beta-1,6-N-acetylglucosamine synthase-like glycosyltransferase